MILSYFSQPLKARAVKKLALFHFVFTHWTPCPLTSRGLPRTWRAEPRPEDGTSRHALANWNALSLCDQELSKTGGAEGNNKKRLTARPPLLQLTPDQRGPRGVFLQLSCTCMKRLAATLEGVEKSDSFIPTFLTVLWPAEGWGRWPVIIGTCSCSSVSLWDSSLSQTQMST